MPGHGYGIMKSARYWRSGRLIGIRGRGDRSKHKAKRRRLFTRVPNSRLGLTGSEAERGGMNRRLLTFAVSGLAFVFLVAGSAAAQGGELVAAEYGSGKHRVDVTPQIRSFVHDGILQFDVNDRNLGVDPARNHVKELFIRIRHWDGNTEEFRFREYDHVNLVLDPERGYEWHDREFHIMRAFYGGAGHFVDVTELLRSMKQDGRLYLRVDNRSMGGDPDREVRKVLRVLYWSDGERRQIVVPEYGELRLP
jgi:hypothetical protein